MLDGKRIMIVEDEALLALDLSLTLEDEGAEIEGPFHRLEQAMRYDPQEIDAALLDVDLSGVPVFPLADVLDRRGIPFVFHTGRADLAALRERYGDVPILMKPTVPQEIVTTVSIAMRSNRDRAA
ncbi:response regulator receiver domain-containing protein [Hasllibacter halocynthiae]|uniref:Response regulator receiver domain-containing protein n=1 Tax=Hasllibacter halocynthiae TaxID=595589 RepID=A0A2T0X0W0_9RHOB|nr:response regulator [Hasllibacter halocynthiae]PRY92586.1 response regulator receiver domain-containing protein [Hasllibacter halocynthiae]